MRTYTYDQHSQAKEAYILKRIDGVAALLNLSSDDLRNQFLNKVLQCSTCGLLAHDVHHSLADLTDLGGLSIGRLLDLVWSAFGECNDKDTQEVSVGGLDVGVCFDESLPLADKGLEFVAGEGHSVEVGQTVLSLYFVDTELDLAEGVFLVVLEVGEGDFEDAAFEGVVGGFWKLDECGSGTILNPVDRLTRVFPTCLTSKIPGALTSYLGRSQRAAVKLTYQSFREYGSTAFFLVPFLPFERRLFLPTAYTASD